MSQAFRHDNNNNIFLYILFIFYNISRFDRTLLLRVSLIITPVFLLRNV